MKTISYILSYVFISLAFYPCTDNACSETTAAEHATIGAIDHSPYEIDPCSPLCVCSCCQIQINQPTYFNFVASEREFPDLNSIPDTFFIPLISPSIWQPPKLG